MGDSPAGRMHCAKIVTVLSYFVIIMLIRLLVARIASHISGWSSWIVDKQMTSSHSTNVLLIMKM